MAAVLITILWRSASSFPAPLRFPKGTFQTSDLYSNPGLQAHSQGTYTKTEPSWANEKDDVVPKGGGSKKKESQTVT